MIKKKKCKICNKSFELEGERHNGFFKANSSPWNTKTCSENCRKKNGLRIAREQSERKKKKIITKKCKYCDKEVVSTQYSPRIFCEDNNRECYRKHLSENRTNKKNPNYKNGLYTHSNFQNRKSKVAYKHLNECRRYKKEFINKYGYQFCELCKINSNGTMRFEVHHIYFASRFPKHKELHNNKNLIHLCLECHYKFHSGKTYEKEFIYLEKERGLKVLFGTFRQKV